jgi:hypothetical protein
MRAKVLGLVALAALLVVSASADRDLKVSGYDGIVWGP